MRRRWDGVILGAAVCSGPVEIVLGGVTAGLNGSHAHPPSGPAITSSNDV